MNHVSTIGKVISKPVIKIFRSLRFKFLSTVIVNRLESGVLTRKFSIHYIGKVAEGKRG